jgi:hypothetical protein
MAYHLRSQRTKLQHAMERLIDSFTEGLIEKDSALADEVAGIESRGDAHRRRRK